ncbi:MAG TPA: GntR family transcriptional regulator [Steroidobacteraceae bacterium]|jgi:GntR family transcriptional regulator of vanillate catabolism|nr:GntR family transcriptional regulator [Steroidobacteraceae bacterium]
MQNPPRARNGDPRAGQTVKALLRLRQLILDGELRAGERVPELRLVERTGVSRTPIRAALLRLAEEGLLEPSSSGGFVVRAFQESDVYDAIDVRGTLEGAAARRAAERRPSHSELNDLRDCVGAMDALVKRSTLAIEQFSDYVRLNERYHALLVALARSPTLSRLIERVVALPFASPSAFVLAQAGMPDAHQTMIIAQDQHRAILEALTAGDGVRAESVAREHSNLAKRNLQAASSRQEPLRQVVGGNLIRLRGE